ncbi:unnamed protein product [Rotaria sordida]|uniref:Uncharacterized protein n=1 Tax=Rotaria sordida TaxID=392033 RepID=A0A815ALS2_9BILA|nr:unnamed protein product [Rotaria sordida]
MASYYEMTNFQASMTVQQQPQEIKNVFGINSGEHILKTYECDETCCGCGDNTADLLNENMIKRNELFFEFSLCLSPMNSQAFAILN